MKNIVKLKSPILIIIFSVIFFSANAQLEKAAKAAWSFDFEKAESYLNKAGSKSNDSLIAQLADVLYFQGKYPQALYYYKIAHNAGAIHLNSSKRNFAHAASLLREKSPYYKQTEYFVHGHLFRAVVDTFDGNSVNEDFSAFYWKQILFVTTSKPRSNNRNKFKYVYTQMPFLDIVCFDEKGNEIPYPKYLPGKLNSNYHDGPICISEDTSLVILTHNYKETNKQGAQLLFLEYYKKENKENWSAPILFEFCKPNYSVQHPFYNNETKELYFSSNMPGGFGGFDLYSSKWDGKNWHPPVNLGSEINSEYDEVFPSITPTGDLLYSSNHIETLGGLDFVIYKDKKRYLLGEPFNTVYDDFSLMFKNNKEGYFTSNRFSSYFDDNIYHFNVIETPSVIDLIVGNQKSALDSLLQPTVIAKIDSPAFVNYDDLPTKKINKSKKKIPLKSGVMYAENKSYKYINGEGVTPLISVIKNAKIGTRKVKQDEVTITQLDFPQNGMIIIDKLTGKPIIGNASIPGKYRFPVVISSIMDPKICDTILVEIEILEKSPKQNIPSEIYANNSDSTFLIDKANLITYLSFDSLVVYFNNDEPRVQDVENSGYSYATAYKDYRKDFKNFYANSIDDTLSLKIFEYSSLEKGYADLDEKLNLIISLLYQGKNVEIDLSAFCSPLAATDYNKQLAKRRNLVVERYIRNWNNGALATAIRYKRIVFVRRVIGELEAPSSISYDVNQKDQSVYGVKTSLERRVNIGIKTFKKNN